MCWKVIHSKDGDLLEAFEVVAVGCFVRNTVQTKKIQQVSMEFAAGMRISEDRQGFFKLVAI